MGVDFVTRATIMGNATATSPPMYGMTLSNAPIIPSRIAYSIPSIKRAAISSVATIDSFNNQSNKIALNNSFDLGNYFAHLTLVACTKEPANKLN